MNLRMEMIADAMRAAGEPYTLDRLAEHLPPDFELIEQDLIEQPPLAAGPTKLSEMDLEPPAKVNGHARTPEDNEREGRGYSEIEPDAIEIERAESKVFELTNALAEARAAVNACARAEGDANGNLAKAIGHFQAGFPPFTPEMLRREFIRSEQQTRAARARGELPPRPGITPGRSRIDQQRAYARGGEHSGNSGRALDMMTGKRVYPASARGAYIGPPKVPSER